MRIIPVVALVIAGLVLLACLAISEEELPVETATVATAATATPTVQAISTPPPTTTLCIPQSEDPIVFVRFGGQEAVHLSQLRDRDYPAIEFRKGKPAYVRIFTPQGHTYAAGADTIQPGPDFCVLAEGGWLPEDFTGEWPSPPELEKRVDTLLLDGVSTTITYSTVSSHSLLYPTAIMEGEDCARVFWTYGPALGPLASGWGAAFTWYAWEPMGGSWHGWLQADPPCYQRCCRPWPQEFTASFGGWMVFLNLEEDFSEAPFGPVGVRSYIGPWGAWMLGAITIDGGETWSSFYSCAETVLTATEEGKSIAILCD